MRFRSVIALGVVGAASAFALSGRWPWQRLSSTPPSLSLATAAPVPAKPAFAEIVDTLHRGETLSELLARHHIVDFDVESLQPALDPRRLRAGLVFNVRRPVDDSIPTDVTVRTGPEQRILLRRVAFGWNASAETVKWTPEIVRIEGDIDNSLYEALDNQVSDAELAGAERVRLAWDLADVYAWQIDFTRDIQPGDHFRVVLERLVSEEGEVRFGRVIASDLVVNGKRLTAFRFTGKDGATGYFDADGNSLKRAFLRAPVEFRRISSNFSSGRRHPVLGYMRKHEGTDYAAAPGTPVMAAGDGVVLRTGVAGGYGNLVELRHRNGITTRYGHLRAFGRGVRPGRHVSQGEIIGYVGSTGLATGPHLHYEFRVDGAARDSRRVALGNGTPVAAVDRSAFAGELARLESLLQAASDSTVRHAEDVASAD